MGEWTHDDDERKELYTTVDALRTRVRLLEQVADAYREFDEEMRNMRSADPTKVRKALAALDAAAKERET